MTLITQRMFIICVAESRTKENACYVSVSNVSVCLCIEHAVSECVWARLLIAVPAIRDCQGISKLHIIQLILPHTISRMRGRSEQEMDNKEPAVECALLSCGFLIIICFLVQTSHYYPCSKEWITNQTQAQPAAHTACTFHSACDVNIKLCSQTAIPPWDNKPGLSLWCLGIIMIATCALHI